MDRHRLFDVSDEPPESMLGRPVSASEFGRLEFFEIPSPVRVTFVTDELQALCPAVETLQPDIYTAEIAYTANTHAVESKSLKLWLVTFRDRRIFAEHLAIEIYDMLSIRSPLVKDVSVKLTQNIRGGIITTVEFPAA
jgi:7-cyano-7-deazaguanine reductase